MGKPRFQKRKPWIQLVKKGILKRQKSIQETIYFLDFLFPPFLGVPVQFPIVQIWMVIWGKIVFPTPTGFVFNPYAGVKLGWYHLSRKSSLVNQPGFSVRG